MNSKDVSGERRRRRRRSLCVWNRGRVNRYLHLSVTLFFLLWCVGHRSETCRKECERVKSPPTTTMRFWNPSYVVVTKPSRTWDGMFLVCRRRETQPWLRWVCFVFLACSDRVWNMGSISFSFFFLKNIFLARCSSLSCMLSQARNNFPEILKVKSYSHN